MKRRAYSYIISVGMSIIVLFLSCILDSSKLTAYASEPQEGQITVENEYVIPDGFGWCTYYVLIATNNTGKDISINADFVALGKDGSELSKVHDYSDAVKKDQRFILYGQFKNTDIQDRASFKYSFDFSFWAIYNT